MTEREKKYLSDIVRSIEFIESFMAEIHTFETYLTDYKTRSAVERQLGIIGEAVNKFLKESGNNNLKNAKQIISLRNRLIHSYDTVDDSIIWAVLSRYISPLKKEVTNLLSA